MILPLLLLSRHTSPHPGRGLLTRIIVIGAGDRGKIVCVDNTLNQETPVYRTSPRNFPAKSSACTKPRRFSSGAPSSATGRPLAFSSIEEGFCAGRLPKTPIA